MPLLLVLSSDDFDTRLNEAIDAIESRKLGKAEEVLEGLDRDHPAATPKQQAYYFRAVGFTAVRQGQVTRAISAFENAGQRSALSQSHQKQLEQNLLHLYVFAQQWDKAAALLDRKREPHRYKSADLLTAHVYHRSGRMDLALARLLRSIDGTSEHGGALTAPKEAEPVVRVAPIYPRRAAERKIEGYVVIRFRVGTAGQVVDPRVIESDPSGVFDRAALKALRKWKYEPRIVDGAFAEYEVEPVKLEFHF